LNVNTKGFDLRLQIPNSVSQHAHQIRYFMLQIQHARDAIIRAHLSSLAQTRASQFRFRRCAQNSGRRRRRDRRLIVRARRLALLLQESLRRAAPPKVRLIHVLLLFTHVGNDATDDGREFEAVARAAGGDDQARVVGVPVDQKIAVKRVAVLCSGGAMENAIWSE
jgi:hypothetical protein